MKRRYVDTNNCPWVVDFLEAKGLAKSTGRTRRNGKKWVMFEDKQCAAGEVKLTDGFKDKLIRWNSDKLIGMESISKEEIDLRKVVKRMRGARPWHPLLQALRKELEG